MGPWGERVSEGAVRKEAETGGIPDFEDGRRAPKPRPNRVRVK